MTTECPFCGNTSRFHFRHHLVKGYQCARMVAFLQCGLCGACGPVVRSERFDYRNVRPLLEPLREQAVERFAARQRPPDLGDLPLFTQ